MPSTLYPLKFEPLYKDKVWGGRRIESLGRQLPGDATRAIGESWELADLGPEAVGGDGVRSIITNGELRGKTIHDALEQSGDPFLGRLHRTATGDFPLLVKYLDARENLSVQVHPSPQYAAEHPDAHVKHEAWYILETSPAPGNGLIYKGIKPGVTESDLRDAIASNEADRVTALLNAIEVKPGQCHYLPSGTCHALGAGVLVAEVQTPSDTTYRVFDWGRTDRELHIEQAMQCIDFGDGGSDAAAAQAEKRTHIAGMFTTVTRLCLCEAFRIEKVRMTEGYEQEIPYDQPTVWMVLEGKGRITVDRDSAPTPFERGETLLVPANMDDAKVTLEADTVWLEVTFPQAQPEPLA